MKKYLYLSLMLLALSACSYHKHNKDCCDCGMHKKTAMVHFAFDSAELSLVDKGVLDKVAAEIQKCPKAKIEITGYTDSVGTVAYNEKLGAERAMAVQSYLAEKGVMPHKMCMGSDGKKDPIASNDTDAGRAKNRRARIKFK